MGNVWFVRLDDVTSRTAEQRNNLNNEAKQYQAVVLLLSVIYITTHPIGLELPKQFWCPVVRVETKDTRFASLLID